MIILNLGNFFFFFWLLFEFFGVELACYFSESLKTTQRRANFCDQFQMLIKKFLFLLIILPWLPAPAIYLSS